MASLLPSKNVPELTAIASRTIATTLLSSNNPSFQRSVYQLPSHLRKPILSAASTVYHVSERCYGHADIFSEEEHAPATDSSRIFLTFEEADAYALNICKMQAEMSSRKFYNGEGVLKHPVFDDCVGYVCRGAFQHNMFYVQACEIETEPGIPISLTNEDEIVCVLLTKKDLRPYGHNMHPSCSHHWYPMHNHHAHMYNKVFAGKTRYARAWMYAEQMASDTFINDILEQRNSDGYMGYGKPAKRVPSLRSNWKNIEIEYTVNDQDSKVKDSKEPPKKKQKKTRSTTTSSTSSTASSTLKQRYIMFNDNGKYSDRLADLRSQTCLAVQRCARGSDTIFNQWNTFDMSGILMHTQKEVELNRVKFMEYDKQRKIKEEKEKRERKERDDKWLREKPERDRLFAERMANRTEEQIKYDNYYIEMERRLNATVERLKEAEAQTKSNS